MENTYIPITRFKDHPKYICVDKLKASQLLLKCNENQKK